MFEHVEQRFGAIGSDHRGAVRHDGEHDGGGCGGRRYEFIGGELGRCDEFGRGGWTCPPTARTASPGGDGMDPKMAWDAVLDANR
ncbi:hypothetical protein KGQ19_26460 [Catenulispora sp. NL8]|uniref:Uncharacterized protein n=1 Tax=Catenulispora pinistramenti TaxID=2705254 RepID=A0ABS5KWG6_9ACTN|nr:hypothetical protein [Catenulispora pinistramenti]MBS2550417.1 hypothetical protein [Catenulispora pinistramenti]